jgi:hypothetical protein
MSHPGWISGAVGYIGTYVLGIVTGLFGHVFKYAFDKATEFKELIVKINREIEAFKGPPSTIVVQSWSGAPTVSLSDWQIRSTAIFSEYALDLKSALELIRWYPLIRHLVGLPSKKNVEEAAKKLPQLSQVKREVYQGPCWLALAARNVFAG